MLSKRNAIKIDNFVRKANPKKLKRAYDTLIGFYPGIGKIISGYSPREGLSMIIDIIDDEAFFEIEGLFESKIKRYKSKFQEKQDVVMVTYDKGNKMYNVSHSMHPGKPQLGYQTIKEFLGKKEAMKFAYEIANRWKCKVEDYSQ